MNANGSLSYCTPCFRDGQKSWVQVWHTEGTYIKLGTMRNRGQVQTLQVLYTSVPEDDKTIWNEKREGTKWRSCQGHWDIGMTFRRFYSSQRHQTFVSQQAAMFERNAQRAPSVEMRDLDFQDKGTKGRVIEASQGGGGPGRCRDGLSLATCSTIIPRGARRTEILIIPGWRSEERRVGKEC